jgi:hypothetical protein
MTKSGKTPDERKFMVRRPLLPAPFWSNAAKKSTEYPSTSSSSTASPLAQMLFKAVLFLVLGIALVPLSLLFRVALRRWTVEAVVGSEERRWRARTRASAGEGVKAIADALSRGESLEQQFPGLEPSR